jgi:localization factor PodJL
MSGAQSWSLKGIDPKVREAAREAAARRGMSLGEYLNQALQSQQDQSRDPREQQGEGYASPRRPLRAGHTSFAYEDDSDWAPPSNPIARSADPVHLAQRMDAIERRTQLAVTGLDRAVSTIDRSVLGLAQRIEESEAISRESAERISGALEHFRLAGDTLGGRLHDAEAEIHDSREALTDARADLEEARTRLEGQARTAEAVARKAEAAAEVLTSELGSRLDVLEESTREALENSLEEARHAAEEASHASFQAIAELRDLQHRLAVRVTESEDSTRRAIETAIGETQTALLQEVVRLESELGANVGMSDDVRAEQQALLSRIEKAEVNAREATAGLRQAAGAAIADLRNAQLGLSARVKQMEDGGGAGGLDLSDVRAQQQDIADRMALLESKPAASPVDDALAAFAQRLEDVEAGISGAAVAQKLDEVGGAVKTLDDNLKSLAERIAETESTANSAIRTLEETVSGLSARMQGDETEALRAMLENRLDEMAQSVQTMVGEARQDFASQVGAALEGGQGEAVEDALADVNRRLAAAERRQAQTIEAISIEIKRMSETVDRRLRTVESRNDDAAGVAVREELAKMSHTLEARFEDIERREAAAFDRMGLEIGRLSDRLEDRVGAVESRSAQAIEHVGEQVARMAERFNNRQDQIARELGERMLDSEERSQARVSEAVSTMMQRVADAEERSAEVVAPVQKAVSSVASRLEAMVRGAESVSFGDTIDSEDFSLPLAPSPIAASQPLRAGPLPPSAHAAPLPPLTQNFTSHPEDDIYFADADDGSPEPDYLDDELIGAAETNRDADSRSFLEETGAFAPAPPEDQDTWSPEFEAARPPAPTPAPPQLSAFDDSDFEDDFLSQDLGAQPGPASRAPPPADAFALDLDQPEPVELPASAPAGKNDYLAVARKAAQAQALPVKTRAKSQTDASASGTPQLRGSSRVVLWGAAGAIALALAGGAWFLKSQAPEQPEPSPAAPEPDTLAPTHALAPPAAPYDPNDPASAAFGPQAPPEGATESGAPVLEPDSAQPPIAAAPAPAHGAHAGAVVAGPLAPRTQSLEQAAQTGDTVAQYELALQRLSAGRRGEGVQLLRRAADRGLAMAQYRLAKLYERGEGVPTDLNLARQWTERAAGAGNRRAMHDLGVYFARGEGAPLDEAAAFRWFRQAAELGVADSQYNLGVLYQQGRGVGASPSEAMFWFMVAARQGDQDASARADALQAQLQPMQVEQARARAQAFRPRAASATANGEFGARAWSSATLRPGA